MSLMSHSVRFHPIRYSPLPSEPPCTYSLSPADVKPWLHLAEGGELPSAAERSVQAPAAGAYTYISPRKPAAVESAYWAG